VANVEQAVLNGTLLSSGIDEALPFLHAQRAHLDVSPETTLDLLLEGHPVKQVWIERIRPSHPVTLHIELRGHRGELVHRDQRVIPPGGASYEKVLPEAQPVRHVKLRLTPERGADAKVLIQDMRVLGQSPELRDHIMKELDFKTETDGAVQQ